MRHVLFAFLLVTTACNGDDTDPPQGDPRGDSPTTGDSSHGDPIGQGDPVAGDPIGGDSGAGDPIAGDPIAGDPVAGDPAAGDPLPGDPATGDPNPGDPTSGDAGLCSNVTITIEPAGSDEGAFYPYNSSEDARSAALYLQSDLGLPGASVSITVFAYRVSETNTTSYTQTVRLSDSSETQLCTAMATCHPYDDTAPVVFSGNVDTSGPGNHWVTYTLDSPYVHDTSLGLIIDINSSANDLELVASTAASVASYRTMFGTVPSTMGITSINDLQITYDCVP